jgi:2-polyprenyl-3-methyl-5-hydroxy-6-metoxy-1,4-benzoquinol methylase
VTFLSQKSGQFAYFDEQLGRPAWESKKVLDLGGNTGNLLRESRLAIESVNYWCVDVSRDAVEIGRRLHPRAHFIFYDRYNFEYNPRGVKGLRLPDTGHKFDYVLALSVFTHTSRCEMFELLDDLNESLNAGGTIAFTFIDPRHAPHASRLGNLRYYAENRLDNHSPVNNASLLDEAERASWCTLADGDIYIEGDAPHDSRERRRGGYLTFHTVEYIRTLFPGAEVRAPVEPITRQHCCILRRDGVRRVLRGGRRSEK